MLNISLDAINDINKKLAQAEAVSSLMMASFDSDIRLNDELSASIAWAITDLITDARQLLKKETCSKTQVTGGNE